MVKDIGMWIIKTGNKYILNSKSPEPVEITLPYFKNDSRGNIVFENKNTALELAEKFKGKVLPVCFVNTEKELIIFGKSY